MPFEWLLARWIAMNQVVRGSLLRCITVPAVTEVWRPHSAHSPVNFLPESSQAFRPPQAGQTKPPGQRRSAKYKAHARSLGNRLAKAAREKGRLLSFQRDGIEHNRNLDRRRQRIQAVTATIPRSAGASGISHSEEGSSKIIYISTTGITQEIMSFLNIT
jgi:hypothetical protein